MNSSPKFRIQILLLLSILSSVAYTGKALALPPSWRTSEGTIQSVCTLCETITFKDSGSQKSYFLAVTPRTKIYQQGRLIQLNGLKSGLAAVVSRKHPAFTPAVAAKVVLIDRSLSVRGSTESKQSLK